MTKWFLPPHKGHRVALDPEGRSFRRYEANQARGDKGIIISDHGNSIRNWVKDGYSDNPDVIQVEVRWDNGHANHYYLKDLLPITSDEKFYAIILIGGDRVELPESKVEEYLNERLIRGGRQVREKELIGHDNKERAYKSVATQMYNKVTKSGQITDTDTKIIEALASHGIGLQSYDEESPSSEEGIKFTVDTSGIPPVGRDAVRLDANAMQDALDTMRRTMEQEREREVRQLHERITGNANPFDMDDLFNP